MLSARSFIQGELGKPSKEKKNGNKLFFYQLAEIGRPLAGLCQLAPAEGLFASLTRLQHQKNKKSKVLLFDYLVVFTFNLSRLCSF